MSNVIEFVKPKNKNDDSEWLFDLSVFGHPDDETSCFITATGPQYEGMNRGAATREMAVRLEDLSFLMRQWAEREDETERGEALCIVTVFAGGHVQVRHNPDKIVSNEQKAWVKDQVALAADVDPFKPVFDAWCEK